MKTRLLPASVAALLALVAPARAASVVLTPSKDSTLIQWSPDTEGANPLLANGLGDIYVGRTNQDGQEAATISIRRGLVWFDLAGAIPAGMKATVATLRMRDVRGLNGDPRVDLHRVLKDWGEGGSFFEGGQGSAAQDGDVTWLHAVYHPDALSTSIAWDLAGGDFEAAPSAEAVVADDEGGGKIFAWSGAGMVTDLNRWLQHPGENFGWLVQGDETRGQSAKRFNSHESTEPPNMPPQLEIEFSPLVAGDYNDDRHVDAADYTVWRNSLNGLGGLVNETATLGSATAEDYVVWKENFAAMGAGSGGAATVPEPAGHWLAVGGSILVMAGSRARFV